MRKVVKFGGSSLANAAQFKKVGEIIRADQTRRYVVPSAPGKRHINDTKVTDMLYHCYELAEKGKKFLPLLNEIKARYEEIIDGLQLELSLDKEFEVIAEQFLKKAGRDYAASRGEYLNGIVMSSYLGITFIDAAEVIFFDKQGNLDLTRTEDVLAKRLENANRAVIPGFYGMGADGKIHTFSRGGSDITGSIVAKAAKADMYENWTDVSGFLIADPRIIHNPQPIETITYRELRELSYMGATVLHEDAIFPVRKDGIPINIRNTNAPQDPGTMIVESTCRQSKYTITGIAGKKGFASVIKNTAYSTEIAYAVCLRHSLPDRPENLLQYLSHRQCSFSFSFERGFSYFFSFLTRRACPALTPRTATAIRNTIFTTVIISSAKNAIFFPPFGSFSPTFLLLS